jgi:hypothetical protein
MSSSDHTRGFKGIKVDISEDGEMKYAAEKLPFEPFIRLEQLLKEPVTEETIKAMEAICIQVPDPDRPETWINGERLELIKQFWDVREAFYAKGDL